MAENRPAKLDVRLKEVHQTDLTEGRVNQDFVDWLKTKGVNYLLIVLVALCAYLGWIRWSAHKTNYQAEAWREYLSASQLLPSSLEDVASKYGDVGSVGELARLEAASKLLRAVQTGKTLGSATPAAPTPEDPNPPMPPTENITPEQRTEYLDRADRLYAEVATADDQSAGRTLIAVTALTGRGVVAESRGKSDEAKSFYEQAAKRAEATYPEIAAASRKRAGSVGVNETPTSMPTQAEVTATQAKDIPPTTTPVDVAGWIRTLVLPDDASARAPAECDPRAPVAESSDNLELIGPGGKVDRDALFALYEREEQASGDDEAPVTVRFELLRDLDKRLDKYLVDRIPFLSRTSLQELIRENAVTVNGRVPKPSTKLHKGDVVVAMLPPPPSNEIPAEDIPLDVLFEDDDLIVINKRDDIIVHPARSHKSGTIINALAWHFQHNTSGALSSVGREFARPGVVHRLDRHTTGVMVAAKSDTAHWRLGKQFENRTTDKRYLAVVHGRMEPLADVIDLPLGQHLTHKEKYAVRWDELGKPSVTIYRVREIYDGFTLVELELKTGRTHQIRVHLSHIGYPIVGDDMYGGRSVRLGDVVDWKQPDADRVVIDRQSLHAAMLKFSHPISHTPARFEAPLPADMRELIALLRQHRMVERPNVSGTTVGVPETL